MTNKNLFLSVFLDDNILPSERWEMLLGEFLMVPPREEQLRDLCGCPVLSPHPACPRCLGHNHCSPLRGSDKLLGKQKISETVD